MLYLSHLPSLLISLRFTMLRDRIRLSPDDKQVEIYDQYECSSNASNHINPNTHVCTLQKQCIEEDSLFRTN